MTITEQKAAQRKAGIAARRALSDNERTHSNAALCARIMALDCFKKAENILLYAAFGGEADLSALAVEAARQGKTLAYPVCGEGFSLTAAVPGPDPRCTRAVKLGVAFEAQRVDVAAVDAHDEKLDGFVTEGGLYFGFDTTEL